MKAVFKYIFLLGMGLLLYTGTALAQQPKTKVTLGIKPDYMYTFKGTGVRINGVLDGETAQKAGLREGDIIMAFDDKPIKDIFAYRDLLSEYSPGEQVKVKVNRDGQIFTVTVRFR